jgi:hypothetical protein
MVPELTITADSGAAETGCRAVAISLYEYLPETSISVSVFNEMLPKKVSFRGAPQRPRQ